MRAARTLLLVLLLGPATFLPAATGQDSAGRAEPVPPPRPQDRQVLLFTYIPQGSSLFSESDLQMAFPQIGIDTARPSSNAAPVAGLPGRGLSPRPPSNLAIMEKTAFTASLVSFVGLNIADYFVTRKVLKQVGLEGVNPIFRAFAKNDTAFAVFKLGYTLMSCISIYSLHDTDKPIAWALSLISNFLVSYALAYNLEQIDTIR